MRFLLSRMLERTIVLLGLLERARDLGRLRAVVIFGNERRDDLVLDGGDAVAALMLAGDRVSLAQLALADRRERARSCSASSFGLSSHGSLAARSRPA